jgi:hypothetical protein
MKQFSTPLFTTPKEVAHFSIIKWRDFQLTNTKGQSVTAGCSPAKQTGSPNRRYYC